jgi:hypothetical protein
MPINVKQLSLAVVISILTLFTGVMINWTIFGTPQDILDITGLCFIIAMYFVLHIVPLCLVLLLGSTVANREARNLVYLILSGSLLLISFVLFSPSKFQGIHIVSIVCLNLFVLSVKDRISLETRSN